MFKVSTRTLTDLIQLSRFPGVLPELQYVVRAFSTGRLTEPVQVDSPSSLLAVSLEVRGYDIYCAYPLSIFNTDKGQVYTCNLGLLGKMTGAAAITGSFFEQQDNGRVLLDTRLKALGKLGKEALQLDGSSANFRLLTLTRCRRSLYFEAARNDHRRQLPSDDPGARDSAPHRDSLLA